MDHVINAIMPFYEAYLDQFLKDWQENKATYKRYSDSPFYDSVKALIDAQTSYSKQKGGEVNFH